MPHTLKYKLIMGFNPTGHPIILTKTSEFNTLNETHKWILTNMLPASIWWIDYKILCDGSLVEEKRNPNLDEDLRSR
jgi:hypothetical protein